MKIRGILLVLLGAAILATAVAAPPRDLAEAEAFGRLLVDRYLHGRVGLVSGVDKMRVVPEPAARRVILFVPRPTRTSPSWQITITLQPHDGLIAHQHLHQPLQQHRWSDYRDEQRTAVQREEYQRALPVLGERRACVHVRSEKVRGATEATITGLELVWIPPPGTSWHLEIMANGHAINLPESGTIRSVAFRDAVDRLVGRMLEALHGAAREAGMLPAAQAREVATFYTAVQSLPHHRYDSVLFHEVVPVPRALTLAAFAPPAAVVPPPVASPGPPPPPLMGARGTPTVAVESPPLPQRWSLPPEELGERARRLGLAEALPDPVPELTVVPPAGATREPAVRPGTAPLGVRGGAAVAPAPRFDADQAVALLLDADARLLATKTVPGLAAHIFVHHYGDWSALVVETETGWHLPVVTRRDELGEALVAFLAVPPRAPARPTGLRLDLDARRLLVLRAVFEWQRTMEMTAGAELVRQTGFPAEEIGRLFASPRFLGFLAPLPDAVQWDVQMAMTNDLLLAVELAALQRQRLVQRLILKGQPRYVLSRDGERVARLLFAPVEQVRLTVVPRQLNDPRPLVHGVNALVLSGAHTAYVSFRPDGQVTYEEEAWRGVSSLPRLWRHLDP